MKSTKKDTKEVKGKEAIGEKEKALKDVFIEESTRVRLKINIIEQEIADLHRIVAKLRDRIGL